MAFSLVGGRGFSSRIFKKADSVVNSGELSFLAKSLKSLICGFWVYEERLWRLRVRTEGLGLMGLSQVDFGLFGSWVWGLLLLERRVVVRGLSWSDKEGFFS